jgi:ABC-2 type transport system ATP-binding protein
MIRVHDLTKTFGETTAVAGVTFDVKPGEIFAFLGPNGAGKTTTIQMLTTLLRPTSGSIAIDGLDPSVRPLEVRQRFGIVFQAPSLDHELTARENVDLHGVLYHVPRHCLARVDARVVQHRHTRHARRRRPIPQVAEQVVAGEGPLERHCV